MRENSWPVTRANPVRRFFHTILYPAAFLMAARLAVGQFLPEPEFLLPDTIPVYESAGAGAVSVRRVGAAAAPVTVNYTVVPQTAVAGIDYLAVPTTGTLHWNAGDRATRLIRFAVFDDTDADGHKTFQVRLNTLAPQPSATVVIMDDEASFVDFTGHRLAIRSIDLGRSRRADLSQQTTNDILELKFSVVNPFVVTSRPGFVNVMLRDEILAVATFAGIPGNNVATLVTVLKENIDLSQTNGDVFAILYEQTIQGPVVQDTALALTLIPGASLAGQNGGINSGGPDFKARDFKTPVIASLAISGPGTIFEGDSGRFTATARLSDGTRLNRPPILWDSTGSFGIEESGVLFAERSVPADTTVTVRARASFGGKTIAATKVVKILDTGSRPFARLVGSYSGLVVPVGPTPGPGFMVLKLNRSSRFTGTLFYEGLRHAITGTFASNGEFTATIARRAPLAALELQLRASIGSDPGLRDPIRGTLKLAGNPATQANIELHPGSFDSKTRPATGFSGQYTVVIPPATSNPLIPQGAGFGVVIVGTGGAIRFVGTLGDASPVSQGATVFEPGFGRGAWAFFVSTHKGRGAASALLEFEDTGTPRITGTLDWRKVGNTADPFYPDGFQTAPLLAGRRYIGPPTNPKVLNLTTSRLVFSGGGLPGPLTQDVSLDDRNRIVATGGAVMTIKTQNGLFSGKFLDAANQREAFTGALVQPETLGFGFFKGDSQQTGLVLLAP